MKVIGAGLPRTATTTQAEAFEILGFGHCYHMRDLLMDPERQLELWDAVTRGEPDWEEIFQGAQSTCDWPGARYYKELAEYYPESKVVLTVRTPESWVRSMRETVWAIYFGDSVMHHMCEARAVLDPGWRKFMDVMTTMTWADGILGPPEATYDDTSFGELMERWNERVKTRYSGRSAVGLASGRRVGPAVRVPRGTRARRARAEHERHGRVQGGHHRRRDRRRQPVVGRARAPQAGSARRVGRGRVAGLDSWAGRGIPLLVRSDQQR